MSEPTPKTVRCAIYTRKSTEENLELDFNTLDAQREAAEAYILSQKHAGWVCLPEHYDDGGFTGGNMDRPAFQRLLADVEDGKIDCILVYKIDRLSRSLLDFARIMEVLDRKNVSLVAVTQQFNTTTSMGRLTLNILLSFAQFEREIISERTRDKIAAARRKGKWTGGAPVLGYDRVRDARGTRLVVNEAEAERVREILGAYLKIGSLSSLGRWLDKRGWRNKQYTNGKGQTRGGKDFDKSTLQKLLTNPLYLGKITFRGAQYDGEHEAIVDEDLFGRVQGMLRRNRNTGGKYQRNKQAVLLKGLVRCKHCGCGMTHHYTKRNGRRYRYYVCMKAMTRGRATCPSASLPAGDLEKFVLDQIAAMCREPALLADVVGQAKAQIGRQIDDLKRERAAQEDRARRVNGDLCQVLKMPDANGAADQMAALQGELSKVTDALRETNKQIVSLQQRMLHEDELTGAFEAFEPMWDKLRADEKARLIHLLIQCIEYDGENEEIAIVYQPGGLEVLKEMEVASV